MSTRSTLTVRNRKDGNESYSIYWHSDGYPDTEHGVVHTLRQALSYAWPLPRFEAMDFSAAIIAAWKTPAQKTPYPHQGGGIYCTTSRDDHGDTEWHYEIYPDKPGEMFAGKRRLVVEIFEATYPNGYDAPTVWVARKKLAYLTANMQPSIRESADV